MPESDLRDKLVSYITDAAAMEANVETMLDGMISTTENTEMKTRLAPPRRDPPAARALAGAPGRLRRIHVDGQGDGRQGGRRDEGDARHGPRRKGRQERP